MGIEISAAESGPMPRRLVLLLRCDAPAGLLCDREARFDTQDGYVGSHAAAIKAGWLERQGPQGRLWVCPACSGK